MPWVMVMVTAMASSRKGGVPEPGKLLDLGQQLQLIVRSVFFSLLSASASGGVLLAAFRFSR